MDNGFNPQARYAKSSERTPHMFQLCEIPGRAGGKLTVGDFLRYAGGRGGVIVLGKFLRPPADSRIGRFFRTFPRGFDLECNCISSAINASRV